MIITYLLILFGLFCSFIQAQINFEQFNSDTVIFSDFIIDGYRFSGNNKLATNYGDNLDYNSTSLFLYKIDELKIYHNKNFFDALDLRAYQVSETVGDTLIIEGWVDNERKYRKIFINIDYWQTLTLNYKRINTLLIKLKNDLDYNIDNLWLSVIPKVKVSFE